MNLDNTIESDSVIYTVGTDSVSNLNNNYVLYNIVGGYPVGIRMRSGRIHRIEIMHDEEGNIGAPPYVGSIEIRLYLDNILIRTFNITSADALYYTASGVSSTLTTPCTYHYLIHDNISIGENQILEATANFSNISGYTGGAEVICRIYETLSG